MENIELNLKELKNVVGGADTSPEALEIIKTVVKTYKDLGYDRADFIRELMKNKVEPEYFKLYLECWDSYKY